ncbi:MAG: FGGY family carbohydrate kinase [Pseudomonadota bacterium]|nr:FGGY family carbohydrate kinase [Pseudomonadota bacterium]
MTPRQVTLVLDQGTHASRAVLVDGNGTVLYRQDQAIALDRPGPRRAEQDPAEIIASVQQVTSGAISVAADAGWQVGYSGLATQRSSILAWRRDNGKPLSPVLSWQDTRGHAFVESLTGHAGEVRTLTGLPLSPHYGASKMRWLIDNCPEVADAASKGNLCIGPLSSFILRHLLGRDRAMVDVGNASRTLLMDVRARRWSTRLMRLFGVEPGWLPGITPVRQYFGVLSGTGIVLTASHGDQPAALLGCGDTKMGGGAVNIGSGAFVMVDTGDQPVRHPDLLTGILDSKEGYATFCLEGTVNGAGSALDWSRKTYGISPGDCQRWADVCEPPIFLNTVGGLGSPWWRQGGVPRFIEDNTARAPGNAARIAAVMESIVFLISANLEAMRNGGHTLTHLMVGGGLSREDALCQKLADNTGIAVRRVSQTEITALGMAGLAGCIPIENPVDREFPPRSAPRLKTRYRQFLSLIGGADA